MEHSKLDSNKSKITSLLNTIQFLNTNFKNDNSLTTEVNTINNLKVNTSKLNVNPNNKLKKK